MSEREELIKRLQDKIIKTICTGLPGPNACKAPDCECYEGNGKPIFRAIEPLFIDLIAAKSDSAKSAPCPRCYGDGPHAECELCHGSGYFPPISALAAQQEQETVAVPREGYWWCPNCKAEIGAYHVTYQECHEDCGHKVEWITPVTAPLPGVRAGMLRAAEICKEWEAKLSQGAGYAIRTAREAITLAAAQGNADQPADAVVVPMELLRQLRHYTECHRMVFKDCGAPTQSEVDAMLRAAQEGK